MVSCGSMLTGQVRSTGAVQKGWNSSVGLCEDLSVRF